MGNTITETGALCISSGDKTGRVPKEKRIVLDDMTRDVSSSAQLAHFQFVKALHTVESNQRRKENLAKQSGSG